MSGLRIAEASGRSLDRWDEDVERSVNGTLFHLRRFLAYHGERFSGQERFLLVLDGDGLLAQIPVAIADEPGGRWLRSPYGASYGGFAFQRYPTWSQARRAVGALLEWCEAESVTRVTLTPPIGACADLPLDIVSFALLHHGFRSSARDVSSVVALDGELGIEELVASRARNTARKAEREGVRVHERADLDDFWSVMDATFERHGTQPTHTLEDFSRLARTVPDRVNVDVAYHDDVPVAGVAYFVVNRLVSSSFYLAQRPDQRELGGLTLCLMRGLARARSEGYRWFDFGTSTASMEPRENVFRFKEQFACAGQFRETFEWAGA
jgi:hypothetical protein